MIMQKAALSRFSALTMYTAHRQLQNKKALLSIESKAGNVKISRKRIRSLYLICMFITLLHPSSKVSQLTIRQVSWLTHKALTVAGPRWFFTRLPFSLNL